MATVKDPVLFDKLTSELYDEICGVLYTAPSDTKEANMPVKIKSSKMNGYSLLDKIGINSAHIEAMSAAVVEIAIQAGKVVFYSKSGTVLYQLPIKLETVELIMDGTLGSASMQAVAMKANKAVEVVLEKLGLMLVPPPSKFAWTEGVDVKDSTPSPMDHAEDVPIISVDIGDWNTVDVNAVSGILNAETIKAVDGEPVKLTNASSMYQPVTATSVGSVYHVIAIAADDSLKFAARYKQAEKSLSVRVEGHIDENKTALENAGFPMSNAASGYVSIHLDAPDAILANRAIGALLCGTGLAFKTPLPDIKKVVGKGV